MKFIRSAITSVLAVTPSSTLVPADNSIGAMTVVQTTATENQQSTIAVIDVNITSPTLTAMIDDFQLLDVEDMAILRPPTDNNNKNNEKIIDDIETHHDNKLKKDNHHSNSENLLNLTTTFIEHFFVDMKTSMHKSICKAANRRPDQNGFMATMIYDKFQLCPRPPIQMTKFQIVMAYIQDSFNTVLDIADHTTSTVIEKVSSSNLYNKTITTTNTAVTFVMDSSYNACNWIHQNVQDWIHSQSWTAGENQDKDELVGDNNHNNDDDSSTTTDGFSRGMWIMIGVGGMVLIVVASFMERVYILVKYNWQILNRRSQARGFDGVAMTWKGWRKYIWDGCKFEMKCWYEDLQTLEATRKLFIKKIAKGRPVKALICLIIVHNWVGGINTNRLCGVVLKVMHHSSYQSLAFTFAFWKLNLPWYVAMIIQAALVAAQIIINPQLRAAFQQQLGGLVQISSRPFKARWIILRWNFLDYLTLSTIKKRYHEFSRVYHPDKFNASKHNGMTKKEAQKLFQEYSAAYNYLTGKSDE